MKGRYLLAIGAVVMLAAAVLPLTAQSTARKQAANVSTPAAVDALPMTCAQAWAASQKQYPRMLGIVTTLAKVSLANRDLTFPNRREAGLDAGRGIAEDCKADPDALLFAVVDKHVRRVVGPTGG